MGRRLWFAVASLAGVLFAVSAQAETGALAASGLEGLGWLGPLGISPLFTLAVMGISGLIGLGSVPAGLTAVSHPALVLLTGLGAAGLHIGRSSKLSKPLAEIAGLGESAIAVFAVLALAAGAPGLVEGLVILVAGLLVVTVVSVVRTALDLLTWLTPLPFVDAGLQLAKVGAAALLAFAAVVSWPVAAGLNALLFAATVSTARASVRALRFGFTLVSDLVRRPRLPLPRDPVVEADIGPLTAFALNVPGLKRRSAVELELRAGRWFLTGHGEARPLGDGPTVKACPTWAGIEFTVGEAVVLLPPRYRPHLDTLVRETGAVAASRSWFATSARGLPTPVQDR